MLAGRWSAIAVIRQLQSVQNAAARLLPHAETTTSQRCFTVYTGYESLNELHSGLRYLKTARLHPAADIVDTR